MNIIKGGGRKEEKEKRLLFLGGIKEEVEENGEKYCQSGRKRRQAKAEGITKEGKLKYLHKNRNNRKTKRRRNQNFEYHNPCHGTHNLLPT